MRTCKRHADESVTYCWECLEEARAEAWGQGFDDGREAAHRELKGVLAALRGEGIGTITVSQEEGHRGIEGSLEVQVDKAGVTHYHWVPPEEAEA